MILSIIIPVYNVEKYIEKCLMSCVNQDISNDDYEIIVVNDGTLDCSMSIVERIANEYDNIRIINQENQGLSAARNAGTFVAKGEYIWYVDSDDYIEENCLGRITSQLKDGLDMLQIQYRLVYEDDTPRKDAKHKPIDGVILGREAFQQGCIAIPAQFSIVRSAFLKENQLKFLRGIYHEDIEFKPRASFLAKKVASDNLISYNYLQRSSGSITAHFRLKNAIDLTTVAKNLLAFCERNVYKEYHLIFYRYIGMCLNNSLFVYTHLNKADKITMRKVYKENKRLFCYLLKSQSIKYIIEGIFFFLSIRFGLLMYRFIR